MGANCVASASIGCLFCCKGCNAEKLRNAFTFIPPPPSYKVEADPKDADKGKIMYCMEELHTAKSKCAPLYYQAAEAAEVRWVTTRRGSRVPVVWFRNKHSSPSAEPSIVLLHCHGNATDIGMMMGPYYELSKILGIEVVGVEYSGYGAASGKPSSGNTYADSEAAYDFLVREGVSPQRIVAYGQSIGSGPVSGLAVKHPQIGGIVLHSPLLSGIKVIDPEPDRCCRPSCVFTCFDFFPNDRNVRSMQSPVFIMHGQRDEVVPFHHGRRLHSACPSAYRWPPYFPDKAGHNDIVETDMRAYFGEVSNFLQDVKRRANGHQVDPPPDKMPKQVEMVRTSVPPSLKAASSERRPSKEPPAGQEVRRAQTSPSGVVAGGVDVSGGSGVEVQAGPEDGRYQAVRARGDIRAAAAGGSAREVCRRPSGEDDGLLKAQM